MFRKIDAACVYGRMAVEFLDPLGRGGKPSNISAVVFAG
jgi:hypothetical protein